MVVLQIATQLMLLDWGWSGQGGLAAIIVTTLVGTSALVWVGLRIPVLRRVLG